MDDPDDESVKMSKTVSDVTIEESKEQMFKWPLDGVSIQAFFAISFQISWLNWF